MYYDSHVHTKFSEDSKMSGLDAYQAARSKGMGIIFTEHRDFNFPKEQHDFTYDPHKYMEEYGALRGMYLLLGTEIGLGEECLQEVKEFSTVVNFDQVIGSIHILDGKDIYEKDSFAGKTKHEFYKHYLEYMRDMVLKNPFIDTLGHIDYIARYSPYEDRRLYYDEFAAEIDGVIKALLETDTVMELNTRRLPDKETYDELRPIYARYKELGGKYITIGSDAHTVDAVGAHIPEAGEFAKSIGLEPVIFYERQLMPLSADY